MRRRSPLVRSLITLAVAICTLATLLSTSSDTTYEFDTAADINQFSPGNIISDAMFFDPNGLTYAQTADFIAAKGTACKVGTDGSPCLKNFRQDTFTRYGDSICPVTYYGAGGETAAAIIWRVAQVCQISPKVLLVLLQKEQALVTTTNPSARKYEIAAGMGCPDTAACDTQYYGFYNQVYAAARQYQRYATYPTKYSYRAGVTNTIQWSPNAACGTSQVYIANQATAGLYNYTPYRPNSAALKAGYGTGDGCSAYGNRNFWLYFTDWFGSTQSPGGDAILAAYAARGGATGPLGPWTTWVICGLPGGGCGQVFQNGTLYWSAATGVHAVSEPALTAWGWSREGGPLGYPTSDWICGMKEAGCGQHFQGGSIYSTPGTGTHAVSGAYRNTWIAQGWEAGPLGYPTGGEVCGLPVGGCRQDFQGGSVYYTWSTGAHAVAGAVATAWTAAGGPGGGLGYPITGLSCGMKESGCGQHFQGGSIFSTPGTGAHALSGVIRSAWMGQGYELGRLGYPTGAQVCGLAASGCKQEFQNGTMYASPAGAHEVIGTIRTAWVTQGAESGPLGYPLTGHLCGMKESGCGQVFQNGRIYSTPGTGAHPVSGAMQSAWIAQGWEVGPLGYPTGDQVCGLHVGGCKQDFQGGTLYSTWSTGTHPVSGTIRTAWSVTGSESGTLGYPTTGLICGMKDGGCGQVFQYGRIFYSASTGAHTVYGAMQAAWAAQGWEAGRLGYPAGDQVCGLHVGGCKQDFQGGTLYSTWSTGTHPVSGAIATAWTAAGAESGTLGYPTSDPYAVPSGTAQDFQGGKLTLDSSTGTVTRS
jgi:uncharacterized protein with LGFP repeats